MQDKYAPYEYYFKKNYLLGLLRINIAILESQFNRGSFKHLININVLWVAVCIVLKSNARGIYIINRKELENWK